MADNGVQEKISAICTAVEKYMCAISYIIANNSGKVNIKLLIIPIVNVQFADLDPRKGKQFF